MSRLEFDEEMASRLEALYRIEDAARRRRLVRQALAAAPGERILDVGCGPGFYCAELLDDVGTAGAVVGVDSSAAMLALAARRCAGRDNVELYEAEAVSLPLESASFDAALSVQVLEYVGDVAAALRELFRVLASGGRVLVWDVDWATLSLHARDRVRTERVLRAWDEHLTHRSLPLTLAPLLRAEGFESVRMDAHTFATIEFDGESFGAALVPFIGAFAAGRQGLSEDDARGWVDEQRELGERGEFSFAYTQFCFTAQKPR